MLAAATGRYAETVRSGFAVSNLKPLEELADMVGKRKLRVHVGMVVGWDDVQSVSNVPSCMCFGRANGA